MHVCNHLQYASCISCWALFAYSVLQIFNSTSSAQVHGCHKAIVVITGSAQCTLATLYIYTERLHFCKFTCQLFKSADEWKRTKRACYCSRWFAIDTTRIVFIHVTSVGKSVHIFKARNRVCKSCLMTELCFHCFVHFDCVPIFVFGFHHKQCANN